MLVLLRSAYKRHIAKSLGNDLIYKFFFYNCYRLKSKKLHFKKLKWSFCAQDWNRHELVFNVLSPLFAICSPRFTSGHHKDEVMKCI